MEVIARSLKVIHSPPQRQGPRPPSDMLMVNAARHTVKKRGLWADGEGATLAKDAV